jgi:hypothetical protein
MDVDRESMDGLFERLDGLQAESRRAFERLLGTLDEHRRETRAHFHSVLEQLVVIRELIETGFPKSN